jgi:hypothetical protein
MVHNQIGTELGRKLPSHSQEVEIPLSIEMVLTMKTAFPTPAGW